MLGTATTELGAATSALAWSFWQYRRGVYGDRGVGITPQMCNRVTNHGDMGTFSRPAARHIFIQWISTSLVFSKLFQVLLVHYVRSAASLLPNDCYLFDAQSSCTFQYLLTAN